MQCTGSDPAQSLRVHPKQHANEPHDNTTHAFTPRARLQEAGRRHAVTARSSTAPNISAKNSLRVRGGGARVTYILSSDDLKPLRIR